MRIERLPAKPVPGMHATLQPLVAALWLVLNSPAAWAENEPYGIGFSQSLTSSSNLFQAPAGPNAKHDVVSSTGILFKLDQGLGRQQLTGEADVNLDRYKNNKQLNGVSHAVKLRLDWATLERLSGQLGAEENESAYLNQGSTTVFTGRNNLATSLVYLNAALGGVTPLTLEGGVAANQSRYSATQFKNQNVQQTSVNLGVRYTRKPGESLRFGLRQTLGRYPDYSPGLSDDFKRTDLELTATSGTGGKSALDVRLAYGQQSYSLASQASSNLWTGALHWVWQATGKLQLSTQLSRDSNVGATSFTSPLESVQNGNTQRTTALDLNATWAATAKIAAVADLNVNRRNLDNSFNQAGSGVLQQGSDRTTALALAVHYKPSRQSDVSCGVTRTQRSADAASLGVTFPYKDNTVGCTAQILFR
jgi:hypothetical protein